MKFYECNNCGNLIIPVKSYNDLCCDSTLVEVVPNSTQADINLHIPVVEREGNTVIVKVGSSMHPMLMEHHIEWIVLETCCGLLTKNLEPNEEPVAVFNLNSNEKIIGCYAYCNIHLLWQTEV